MAISKSRFVLTFITPLISVLLFIIYSSSIVAEITINKNGCDETKFCLFKPPGCDPQFDCTLGLVLYVSGPNKLNVQMVAKAQDPPPPFQYIAVAFSKDTKMGDDFVSECVLSPSSSLSGETEVFASYNTPTKGNDRTNLTDSDRAHLFTQIEGSSEDGILKCSFVQAILPELNRKELSQKVWDLNKDFYVLAATGSSQADEVNAHDMSRNSHYYPIVSQKTYNPSVVGSSNSSAELAKDDLSPIETNATEISSKEGRTEDDKEDNKSTNDNKTFQQKQNQTSANDKESIDEKKENGGVRTTIPYCLSVVLATLVLALTVSRI